MMLTRQFSKALSRQPFLSALRGITVSAYDNEKVSLTFSSGKKVDYNTVFLRDSCTAPESVDKFSQQKLFTTSEISQNLKIEQPPEVVETDSGLVLNIVWNQNGQLQKSQYTEEFLEEYSSKANIRKDKFFESERVYWSNQELVKDIDSLQIEYEDYANNERAFYQACYNLNRYGLCFINNIPRPESQTMSEENATTWPVYKLAEKFGYIKKTFYGTLFDVKNVKEATNIAYTKTFLPLHMDLLYYESPPGLQLLHFIYNSTAGGENIFSDSFRAALHVKETDPVAYEALKKVPITFHYDNNNEYYYYSRPLIVEDESAVEFGIKEVNFAPSFQGPLEFGITNDKPEDARLFKDFLRGFNLFDSFVNDPKNHYELKVPEGTTVIFDNRRVLHSRLAFSDDAGGDRWLMGTYVDGDSFRSKLRVGHRKFA